MSRIETRWDKPNNEKLLSRYLELNLIPFSCVLTEEMKNGEPKKQLPYMPSFSKITTFDRTLVRSYNGLCIKVGTKLDDRKCVLLLGIDNKHDTKNKWRALVKQQHKSELETPNGKNTQ